MEFESTNSGTTAKLPILKLAHENGTSVTKMSIPVTAEEKTNKKIDVKARSLLLMALPNEHQLTLTTKKTQKILLKQQYKNFSASSAESLDFIFNRLQKIVSRLAILGVVIAQEDLNSKFLSSLPPEWNTHVVVWMNKPEVETMSIDDLYNNFKIVEQKVKKSVGASSGAQNLAFMTAPSTSSTNDANTASPQVSTANPNVNAASPQVSTASVSDNTVYAFMVENPNGSNVLHQDLEQIHEDDLEAMDLKWQLSLLSVRAKKYYQRTGKKIFINANDTAGYDKSKVKCYNCNKLGHFARKCRAPRSKEGQFRNQDNTRKQGNNEDTSSKAMFTIYGVGFDWSDMAEEQVQTNMALMAFSDSELNQTEFTAATYKRGLATVEDQLITYRKNEFEKVKQEKDGIEFKIEKFDKASKDLDQLLGSQITDKSKKGLGYSAVPPPHPLIYNRPKKLDLSYSGLDEFKEPEFKGYGPENSEQESNVVCDKKSDNSKENSDESLVEEQVSQDTSSFVESSPNVDKETIFPVNKKVEFTKPKNHEKPVKKSVRYAEMYRSQSPRGNQRNWNGQKSNQLGKDFVMYNKACFICGSFNHLQNNCDNLQRRCIVSRNSYNRVDAKTTHPSVHRNMFPKAVLLKTGLTPLNTVSGCSRHMTGSVAYLSDFKEFDGGYISFGGGAYSGRITDKGTFKTNSLDFEDVYFVNELKFNLFSVSQMEFHNEASSDGVLTSYTVMSDSEDSTVTYTAVSSPFEDGSDIGSPGVDGPPIMPEDPYAYIMAAYQVPPSPDYIPGPEEPQSPPPLDFVPEPMYPEYIPQEDEILPAEEQPLPAAASPTADSPGYVPESDPEEEPEEDDEDPEEDPADYPADRDDDDDDDEDEDEDEEEEEEHPAPADSVPPVHRMTARISIRDEPSISLPPREEVERLLALTTPPPSPLTPLSSPLPQIPSPPPNSPTHIEIPESCLPLRKRVRFASPTPSHEVGEREDLVGAIDEIGQVNLVGDRDKAVSSSFSSMIEREANMAHELGDNPMDAERLCTFRMVKSLRTTGSGAECIEFRVTVSQITGTEDGQVSEAAWTPQKPVKYYGLFSANRLYRSFVWLATQYRSFVQKMAPRGRPTRLNPNATPTPVTDTHTTTSVTNSQIQATINEGVTAALAARDATRNGDDSHTSRTGARRPMQVARECTYPDFLKCQPLNFKGTEGVVGLTQWFEKR
ncbi:putative ribonuclease H-like domain-containing protein, partial [Tanacetum coccineum]